MLESSVFFDDFLIILSKLKKLYYCSVLGSCLTIVERQQVAEFLKVGLEGTYTIIMF